MAERPQPTFNRRVFLKGLIGVGAALGIPGCSTPQKAPDSLPSSSFPGTDTTPQRPSTTVSPSTLPESSTSTTLPERTFSSPEQKQQVELAERAMEKFYSLTKADVASYKETTSFVPDPSGFSNVESEEATHRYRQLGINLGIVQTQIGDSMGTVQLLGMIDALGNKVVVAQIFEITDSGLLAKIPNFNQRQGKIFVGKDPRYGAYYLSLNGGNPETPYHVEEGMDALKQALQSTVGSPILTGTDVGVEIKQQLFGYPTEPNPMMEESHSALNTFRGIAKIGNAYNESQLASVGIIPGSSQVPQAILDGYPTIPQSFAHLPLSSQFNFFEGAPPVFE